MLTVQKVHLAFIVVPAIVLAFAMIVMKKNIGLWLIRYGVIIALPGAVLADVFGKSLRDVLLLIDTGGFGRAYVCGCMLLLAGIIVQAWNAIGAPNNK